MVMFTCAKTGGVIPADSKRSAADTRFPGALFPERQKAQKDARRKRASDTNVEIVIVNKIRAYGYRMIYKKSSKEEYLLHPGAGKCYEFS